MKKKMYIIFGVILSCFIGCMKYDDNNSSYTICNESSNGTMAEIESGFFYTYDSIMYYADRDHLDKWIVLCNKPNCEHTWGDVSCNACLFQSVIVQKNGKLYGCGLDTKTGPFIYEISQNGSGLKKIYNIPVDDEFAKSNQNGYGYIMSQDQLLMLYSYLDEFGYYQQQLLRVDDNNVDILYENKSETQTSDLFVSGNSYYQVRGDDVFLSMLLLENDEEFQDILCRIVDNQLERINLPEGVACRRSYLNENIYMYFQQNEGFYELNLKSGEKKLLCNNQLEDSQGVVLTENYMVEYNTYKTNTPEIPYLKFYDGDKWIDVSLPEEINNPDLYFSPLSVASDRIFFKQSCMIDGRVTGYRLYYFMLGTDNPTLIYASTIGTYLEETETSTTEEETTSIQKETDIIDFDDVVVFDNENYRYVFTEMLPNNNKNEGGFILRAICENNSLETNYQFFVNFATINGIQCNPNGMAEIYAGQQLDDVKNAFGEVLLGVDETKILYSNLEYRGINSIYNIDEYFDIEIGVAVLDMNQFKIVDEKVIHIYPKGKEYADESIHYARELQEQDKVIVDNDIIKMVVIGYEENGAIVFIENKQDKNITITISDEKVNRRTLSVDSPKTMFPSGEFIFSKGCIFTEITWDKKELAKKGITQIEEAEILLTIYESKMSGEQIGENLMCEFISFFE